MNPRRANQIVLAAALGLGAVAFISTFLPPFPMLGWYAAAFTLGPFENWWYSLPDDARSVSLYTVGTTVASACYPAIMTLTFWLWCRPLRTAGSLYPRRTVTLGAVAVGLSVAHYAFGWSYGLRYQGIGSLTVYLATSTAILIVLALAWRRCRSTGAWWPSLGLHWALFAWVCVAAFPWLGEMI